jgi:DNA-binding MurR/RpiR family transcriptional regulator
MDTILQQLTYASSRVSPSLQRVGQWIVTHPIQALSLSADEIAVRTKTSVAAVNRFAKAAGLGGFADMRIRLGEELDSAMEPVQKLQGATGKSDISDSAAQEIFDAAQSPEVVRLADRISQAKRVWFLGLGASNCFANYAEHSLTPFVNSVFSLAGNGGTEEVARRLAHCAASDILIALSLPRFSKDTVMLSRFAQERGTFVAAITDGTNQDLLEVCDLALVIRTEHVVLPSSGMGMLAVLESLIALLVKLNPDAVGLARELTASVFSYVSVKGRG